MLDSKPAGRRLIRAFNSLLSRILLVVAVALLPAFGFLIYSKIDGERLRQQFMEEQALRLTALVNAEQSRVFEGAEQILDLVDGSPLLQLGPSDCGQLLSNIVQIAPRYVSVVVIAPHGGIGCAPAGQHPEAGAFEPAVRLALQSDGLVIGEYVAATRTGPPSIAFAKRFRGADGAIGRVVAL